MTELVTRPNIATPDEIYAELIAAHEGLGKEESDAYNARLILILMNHVGDAEILRQALAAATVTPNKD